MGRAVLAMRLSRLLPIVVALLAPALLLAAAPPSGDIKTGKPSLQGQFLIATPEMSDPRFREAVLVMIRHGEDGAMAVMINRPAGEQPLGRLLEALGESSDGVSGSVPIYLGGPVQMDLALVLHSSDYHRDGTRDVATGVAMTATPEVFRDIAKKTGPAKYLLAFGYAGWAPGQIENEMLHNGWYTAPLDPKLVFDEDRSRVWERAMERRTRDL
jgi:putative transcriptional regulator